jgi:hypothetical protein
MQQLNDEICCGFGSSRDRYDVQQFKEGLAIALSPESPTSSRIPNNLLNTPRHHVIHVESSDSAARQQL